ncbi:granulin b isoform X2 [Carcharodon carcharias]|uniref:granulin b isoform X2 n=1 Tax=Carcharodon carcharias TaxID=13397 RepID=UPI001B7DDCDB|nr:granulin b isoform X2 [Carcharodon carcharias]
MYPDGARRFGSNILKYLAHFMLTQLQVMIQKFVVLWLATGLASAITCPDGSKCPDGATCCKTSDRGYFCCLAPKAVCCSDFLHCCPENTTCDLVRSICRSGLSRVPWVKKVPAIHTETTMWEEAKATPLVQAGTPNAVTENMCLDNTECPPEYTCMPTSKGFYGCCPLTEATICKDWEHCCPKGYECDLNEAKCKRTGVKEEKLPLVSGVGNLHTAESELCGNMSCSGGYTCCTSKNFGWGCCPMKDAVCCDDNYCCPKDFKCDKVQKTCIKPIDQNVKAIICPDRASECPDGSTCCLLPDQQWGCCPLQKAVCCEDRLHCCPSETKCDLKQSKCVSQFGMMEMWKKFPAHKRFTMKNTKVQVVHCNDTMACPDGNTCCKLASGDFGCCPIAKAVCCADHEHCCPNGYKCNSEGCYQDISIPWLTKTPAIMQGTVMDVKCNDTMSCPDGSTCCKQVSGDWGCCPIPQAVCCADHIHCCPNGYTCDVQQGLCEKQGSSIPMILKLTASVERNEGRMCDDATTCSSGTTCCRNNSGGWSCCPFAQAVCCENVGHCCPNGYDCDVQHKVCKKKPVSFPWTTNEAASMKTLVKSRALDTKCDDTMSCPTGSTCCRRRSGDWGCCPLTEAVCCTDHEHCCPHGYTCNVSAGTCEKQSLSVPLEVKQSSASKLKCDDKFSCQSPATCCKITSGDWACCPYEQATCCEDQLHCCPNGYTCNGATKMCTPRRRLRWDLFFPKQKKAFERL